MCGVHLKEIDSTPNLHIYTVEWLLEKKHLHEEQARKLGEISAPPEVVTALMWTDVS
jgi:hypothetical protein